MLIKKDRQVHIGDLINFYGPCVEDVNKRKKHIVKVKQIYSHWVLGEILEPEYNDNFSPKLCMTNVDLVLQNIYSKDDVEGNSIYEPIKPTYDEKFIQKVKDFNDTHVQKTIRLY